MKNHQVSVASKVFSSFYTSVLRTEPRLFLIKAVFTHSGTTSKRGNSRIVGNMSGISKVEICLEVNYSTGALKMYLFP